MSWNQTAGRVIAAAWSDPEFLKALLADAVSALRAIGMTGPPSIGLIAEANDPATVHLVLGGPPRAEPRGQYSEIRAFGEQYRGDPRLWSLNWRARDPVARQRIVDSPKAELSKLGFRCPPSIKIVILVNTPDLIHIVIPERPAGVCSPAMLSRLRAGHIPEALRFGRLYGEDAYGRTLQRIETGFVEGNPTP